MLLIKLSASFFVENFTPSRYNHIQDIPSPFLKIRFMHFCQAPLKQFPLTFQYGFSFHLSFFRIIRILGEKNFL